MMNVEDFGTKDQAMYNIDVVIKQGTPASQWHQLAVKRARAAAQEKGIEWVEAKVFVYLPEKGRCFTKAPGYTQLVAHG